MCIRDRNEDHRGTILYLHGGGWANGDVEFYSDACMRTALKLERRVIAVDYRRSPEHRFPTALEDCYAVARQLFAGTLIRDADQMCIRDRPRKRRAALLGTPGPRARRRSCGTLRR